MLYKENKNSPRHFEALLNLGIHHKKAKGGVLVMLLPVLFLEKPRAQMRASLHWVTLEVVYGTAWEVYYRCEIVQYVSRVNVYSFSKFNPPTFECSICKWIYCCGLWIWNSPSTAMWNRGMDPGRESKLPPHLWATYLILLKSESKLPTKIKTLVLVKSCCWGVL